MNNDVVNDADVTFAVFKDMAHPFLEDFLETY